MTLFFTVIGQFAYSLMFDMCHELNFEIARRNFTRFSPLAAISRVGYRVIKASAVRKYVIVENKAPLDDPRVIHNSVVSNL